MTNQFYLLNSRDTAKTNDYWILREDPDAMGGCNDRIVSGFSHQLRPLGTDLAQTAPLLVPEGTRYVGVLWGDGELFSSGTYRKMGLLGHVRMTHTTEIVVHTIDGRQLGPFEDIAEVPPVLPPEAFGLVQPPWWPDVYEWCR